MKKYKKGLFILVILILVLYNPFIVKPQMEKDQLVDRLTPKNFQLLFDTIENLYIVLVMDDGYTKMSNEKQVKILETAGMAIFSIQDNFLEIRSINKNFNINVLSLETYIYTIYGKVESDQALTEADIDKLSQLHDLLRDNLSVESGLLYHSDNNPFTKETPPKQVNEFIEKLNQILN